MDLDVKMKATMLAACFLIVSGRTVTTDSVCMYTQLFMAGKCESVYKNIIILANFDDNHYRLHYTNVTILGGFKLMIFENKS